MSLGKSRRASENVRARLGGVSALILTLLAGGCGETAANYQAPGEDGLASGRRILVLPFLDARTFVDERDPHREDLGERARDIFAEALRGNPAGRGAEILVPPLPRREESLSLAEAAELGRRQGADLVVAGQIFSYTGTRAASIPPRAGMFVRIISAGDGTLLFVGDSYQAAAFPGAPGGRELQARQVAAKLVDGFAASGQTAAGRKVASTRALAQLLSNPASRGRTAFRGGYLQPDGDGDAYPEEDEDDFAGASGLEGDGLDLPPLNLPPDLDAGPEMAAAGETAAELEETAGIPAETPEAAERDYADAEADPEDADPAFSSHYEPLDLDELALRLSGDDLAEDIFAEGETLLAEAPRFRPLALRPSHADEAPESMVLSETAGPGEKEAAEAIAAAGTPPEESVTAGNAELAAASAWEEADPGELAELSADSGPVRSVPLAAEQPRAFSEPSGKGGVRVLLLPYHDRDNPHNLISHTGGGEVVTSIFGAHLADHGEVQLLWDATGQAGHDRLPSREESIEMGRLAGADYVVRGEVLEFRRAQSVPSLYSAVISTAILAAQLVFAEMSGVDVATEVYRVSDGRCVVSRRDRSQQKYVVQAEKTVRRLASGAAGDILAALADADAGDMDPLIDAIPVAAGPGWLR